VDSEPTKPEAWRLNDTDGAFSKRLEFTARIPRKPQVDVMTKLYLSIVVVSLIASAYYLLPESEESKRSARLRVRFTAYGCSSCHVISAAQTSAGKVGPALTGLGSRAFLAGRLPNTHKNLVRWIRFPHEVDPSTLMPNLNVTESDAQEMAQYLNESK
jgi:cytochrome c2